MSVLSLRRALAIVWRSFRLSAIADGIRVAGLAQLTFERLIPSGQVRHDGIFHHLKSLKSHENRSNHADFG
jgi:hypothetical protein